MGNKLLEHLYHVYRIAKQGHNDNTFLAEGPGTHHSSYGAVEPIITNLDRLPKAIMREHLYYLKEQGFNQISKSEDIYISFAFSPLCQKVLREGQIYNTFPLCKNAQKKFCRVFQQVYQNLDDVIDLKKQGNPLE